MESVGKYCANLLDAAPLDELLPNPTFRELVSGLSQASANLEEELGVRVTRTLLSLLRSIRDQPQADYESLFRVLDREIPFHGVTLFLRNADGKSFDVVYRNGPVVDLIDRFDFGQGKGFSSWVGRHQKQALLTNVHQNPEHRKAYMRSYMASALPHRDHSLGVLSFSHTVPDAFDESDLEVLRAMAPVLGSLLHRIVTLRALRGSPAPDDLTGLLSRHGLERHVRAEFHHAQRQGTPLTLAVFRVSDLDAITSSAGPAEADRALAGVGRKLRRLLAPDQTAARINRSEFVVILPHIDTAQVREIVECCAHAIEQVAVDRGPGLRAVVGSAELRGEDSSGATLMDRAMHACSVACQTGRDLVLST